MEDFEDFFPKEIVKTEVDYSQLNKQQLEAVNTTEGPVLIIAGAGSGKTKVLTCRVAKLIDNGVDPSRILLLTFTNKAANEMIERAQIMLDERVNKITACTYHSFCVRVLRKYHNLVGVLENFSIISPPNCVETLNYLKEQAEVDKDRDIPSSNIILNIFSFAVNKDMDISEIVEIKYPKYEDGIETIKMLKEEYDKYKIENNQVDYDDLIILTNKLFRENPKICKRYSDIYQYIMVDEYQDSNNIQLEFLSLLRQFDNQNICVVGDDQQCIYSWRGANFKNIINFPNYFKKTKLIKLIQNYRSNQEILDLSNAILNNATEKYEKQLLGQTEKGELPLFVHVNNLKSQSDYVINRIIHYHEVKKVPYSDMAVLIRSSNDSLELELAIQEKIHKTAIPFKKFGGMRFLDKEICQDILAYLAILTNPKAEVLWFRVLKLYPFIGKKNSQKIASGIKANGIDELLDKKYEKKKYANYILELHDEYNKMKSIKDLDRLVNYLLNNYYQKVKKRSIEESKIGVKSKKATKADLLNKLDQDTIEAQVLVSVAKKYGTIDEYLEALALDSTDSEDGDEDFLTISTIHSAKGLEFKIVFILSCIDSTFPGERPPNSYSYAAIKEHEEEIEESRRLLYVAITRAKEDLYLMYPEFVHKFGQVEKAEVSRFLEEDDIYKDYCKHDFR